MPSFADKKAQRDDKRSKTLISENITVDSEGGSQEPSTSAVTVESQCHNPPVVPVVTVPDGLYTDLPSSLSVRKDDVKGKGLWSNLPSRKGSTLLKTSPFIYVLSIPNLPSYCSYCIQPASGSLKRCTKCKQIWYCSSICQNADWRLHKHECTANLRWITASPEGSPPPEAVRAIGRILFARQVLGKDNSWWKEIQELQSHRLSLQPSVTESYIQLAHALTRFLGVTSPAELEPYGLRSAGDIVDLISRFTTNAFTLTSPLLTSLGVCLSPVVSLLNHSCQPNAIVVFPGTSSSKSPSSPLLNVIALKDIKPDEEILISYVDVTFPAPERQGTLKKSYNFTCTCPLCSKTTSNIDQREAVICPKDCGGRCAAPFGPKHLTVWRCSSCKATYSPDAMDKVEDKRRIGQEAYDKASKFLSSDPEQAFKVTANIIPLLAKDLPPSAHPLLNILRLHQTIITDKLANLDPSITVDDGIRNAGLLVTGLIAILDEGDPILGIALAELGKLLAADEPPESAATAAFTFPPRGPPRLALALETSKRALENLKIGFGRENEGGAIGIQIREDIVKLEREAQAWQHFIRNAWEDTVLQRRYERK